jgi:hypothetical protein
VSRYELFVSPLFPFCASSNYRHDQCELVAKPPATIDAPKKLLQNFQPPCDDHHASNWDGSDGHHFSNDFYILYWEVVACILGYKALNIEISVHEYGYPNLTLSYLPCVWNIQSDTHIFLTVDPDDHGNKIKNEKISA